MSNNAIGRGLYVLNRIAANPLLDRLKIRRPLEKLIFTSVKHGFRLASATARVFSSSGPKSPHPNRLNKPGQGSGLFDLTLSEEQQMLRDSLQRFAKEVLRPQASAADRDGAVPAEVRSAAQELGLALYAVPEALGGAATEDTVSSQMLIVEDLSHGDMGQAVALLAPIHVANALTRWGTAEQQDKYLSAFTGDDPPVATFALTEPTPLFDAQALSTQARQEGGDYILSGRKAMVALAAEAELFLVSAQTPQGPAVFIVEGGTPGLSVEAEGTMGLKAAAMAAVVLDNVRVPAAQRLGAQAFDYEMFVDLGTLAWCALAVGTCQAVLDYVIPACNDRVAFGEPISHRQAVAFMIANIGIELEAMRLMTWRAAARAEQGLPFHREAYLARVLVTEKAMQIGTDGVQLLGGHGFTKEHPVERWYRDLRATAFGHGLHL